MSLVCLAAQPEAPALSVKQAREALVRELTEQVYVRMGLGDGRGAARALGALAAVAAEPDELAAPAFQVLDLYANVDVPADIRSRLIARKHESFRKATVELIDALNAVTADHPLPEQIGRPVVLGPGSGCPVRQARAFAEGPGGELAVLAEGIALFDGKRWQMIPPGALHVDKPIRALHVDGNGRMWLGSSARAQGGDRLIDRLRREQWTALGYFDPPAEGLGRGRWHSLHGTGSVTSFAEARDALWIAAHSRLFRFTGQRGVPAACPLPYSPTRTLLAAPDRPDLWVVDARRISHFDGRRWRSFELPEQPARGGALLEGKPVVALPGGLWVLEGGRGRLLKSDPTLGPLAAVASGPDGTAWCLTEKGALLSSDLASWTVHGGPVPADDRANAVPAVFCDSKGRVWLSRGKGVEVYGGRGGAAAQRAAAEVTPL
ncbi:MAG: hypothetical protein R6V58_15770, partial [Planctomycetota bacterium]